MTNRVRSALGRFVAFSVALVTVSVFAVASAAAQGTTGKIQGTVTDPAGTAIARAQVVVVGTAFGAVTDDKGYYFINNVPVGTYSLKAQFIGYAPMQQDGARVLGGQTVTFDFKMTQSTVAIAGLTVTTQAVNALVPRDQVTSKSIVSGSSFQNLPVSNVRNVITLQPGVVESNNGLGVSLRGGRPGEANVYIDGVPVRALNSGAQGASLQTNAVEEASVTTGGLGIEFGDAQSGVIQFTTKSGGDKLGGSLSAQSDGINGANSMGFSRFEGTINGPVPMVQNLKFFLSGEMDGVQTPFRPLGADKVPTYTIDGIDTTVNVNTSAGVQSVAIPRFVQYSGSCDAAKNFGFACQGARQPMNWANNINLDGKLSYTYGTGSSISLTGLAAGDQFRNWPGTAIGDPALYSGQHDWSRTAIANWTHQLFKTSDRELSVNLKLSYQTDNSISGPLTPASDLASRNPTGGYDFTPLQFSGYGSFLNDFFNNPDAIIHNIRTNTGERIPELNRTDLNNAQPYRMNPYGMKSGGFVTTGSRTGGTLYRESRYIGLAQVDWQANRFHRFNFGVQGERGDLALWSSNFVSQIFMNAYHTKPVIGAAWAGDRLDLGDVVLDVGIRYDYYNSHTLFSNTPAFTFGNVADWDPAAQTSDAAYQAWLKRTFTPSVGHNAISPRIGVSFPITEQTDFHLSYAHQVQSPDMSTVLAGTNNDLSFTNANDRFGRDVGFGKTILFEFGVRHSFNPDFVFDLSAYNKAKESDLTFRIFNFDDASNPGRSLTINVLTNGDFGYARGIDLKVDRRVGSWFAASVAYTFEVARSTGSDPFTYLNTNARSISGVTGSVIPPAEQPRAVNHQREHNIVGSVQLTVPNDWQKGTTVGSIFQSVSAFVTFRALSGLPYTAVANLGAGQQTSGGTNFGLSATQSGDINSQTLPWTKYLDLRVNKGLRLGKMDVTAFADIRNLMNWKNITSLFAETNDVTNSVFQAAVLSPELSNNHNDAATNGSLRSDGALVLNNCASWSGDAGPVNCVMLQRAEARFGNGDGVFTLAEQTAALNAYYDRFQGGAYRFNDAPRSVRLGVELSF